MLTRFSWCTQVAFGIHAPNVLNRNVREPIRYAEVGDPSCKFDGKHVQIMGHTANDVARSDQAIRRSLLSGFSRRILSI